MAEGLAGEVLLASILCLASRLYFDRTARGRDAARRLYSASGLPMYARAMPATAPLTAGAVLVVALALIAPHGTRLLIGSLGVSLIGVVRALSYRRPPPLAPRWMTEDLASGRLVVELDWIDSAQRWVLIMLAVLSPMLGVILTMAGQSA